MKGIPNEERQRLGALLDHQDQASVMAMIPQFAEAEVCAPVPPPAEVPEQLGLLVFNMGAGRSSGGAGRLSPGLPGHPPAGRGAGQ